MLQVTHTHTHEQDIKKKILEFLRYNIIFQQEFSSQTAEDFGDLESKIQFFGATVVLNTFDYTEIKLLYMF